MTSLELGQRLIPNLPGQSILDLSMTDTMEVLDAVNTGLAMFYDSLPRQFRKTTRGVTINAPQTFDGSTAFYTAGSPDLLLAGITTAALEGCSCSVGGDTQVNRLKSVNEFMLPPLAGATGTHAVGIASGAEAFGAFTSVTIVVNTSSGTEICYGSGVTSAATFAALLDDCLGNSDVASEYNVAYVATTGVVFHIMTFTRRALGPSGYATGVIDSVSHTGSIPGAFAVVFDTAGTATGSLTVYGDAVHLGSDINRLLEPPIVIKADGSRFLLSEFPDGFDSLYIPLQSSDPRYYEVEPTDRSVASQSHTNGVAAYSYDGLQASATIARSDANYYLRLWPFPQTTCRLLYTAELKADRLVWSDFSVSRTLKLLNADAEGLLIPIILGELAKKRLFTGEVPPAILNQQVALDRVSLLNATTGGRPRTKIKTTARY